MEEMMSKKPTELAEEYFRQAQQSLTSGITLASGERHDAVATAQLSALINLMKGLVNLSTGLLSAKSTSAPCAPWVTA
jgi:hypothetical protein